MSTPQGITDCTRVVYQTLHEVLHGPVQEELAGLRSWWRRWRPQRKQTRQRTAVGGGAAMLRLGS